MQAAAMPQKRSAANIALGDAIRAVRKERGYTQESFAGEVGLDRSYYGSIERAEFNITIETLMRIATGLDVSAATLLTRAKI